MALWSNPSFFPKRLAPAHFNQAIELAAYDPSCLQDEETSSARRFHSDIFDDDVGLYRQDCPISSQVM